MAEAGTTRVRAKAEPDCSWHSRQWQTFRECGSAVMEYVTLPHWQRPVSLGSWAEPIVGRV